MPDEAISEIRLDENLVMGVEKISHLLPNCYTPGVCHSEISVKLIQDSSPNLKALPQS